MQRDFFPPFRRRNGINVLVRTDVDTHVGTNRPERSVGSTWTCTYVGDSRVASKCSAGLFALVSLAAAARFGDSCRHTARVHQHWRTVGERPTRGANIFPFYLTGPVARPAAFVPFPSLSRLERRTLRALKKIDLRREECLAVDSFFRRKGRERERERDWTVWPIALATDCGP